MKKMIMGAAALSTAMLILASPACAQNRWAFEFRGHGAVGSQDVERESSEAGFGYEGAFQFRVLPHLSAYAGWDWARFDAIEGIAGPGLDLEETGYALGLRFEHPFAESTRAAYWLRVGATVNHLELEDAEGSIVDDSGHGLGWEFGAGLALPVSGNWSLTPGVRYRSLNRDLGIGTTVPVELRYLAFELGFSVGF